MNQYSVLSKQVFESGSYSIVPIRFEDRYAIMQWRNEQIYHLRQSKHLSKEDQDTYFNEVVARLFSLKHPNQILFSYLKDGNCIGYGGLVHISWVDMNAEISFIMDTSLEEYHFEFHWCTYLSLIEKVAFEELKLHKIYTYAFDLRPRLYISLERREFRKEAVLKEHCFCGGKFVDVLIHSKFNDKILLREATSDDLEITYEWANNKSVRTFSYNQSKIIKEEHAKWFRDKINSDACIYYILEINSKQAGSIRFDIEEDQQMAKISYLIDPQLTGKGYGTLLLEKGVAKLMTCNPMISSVYGYVLKGNLASVKIFQKLGYEISFESDNELKFEKKLT